MSRKLTMWIGGVALIVLAVTAFFAINADRSSAEVAQQNAAQAKSSAVRLDVEKMLAPRSMGDPKAPVRLEEFASLSCPHCAHFATEVFEQIKTAYIDTGKLYFTFTDYPLNAPALEGAVISHCVPEDQFFKFLSFLYQTQDQWAFADNYKFRLEQNAKLLGMTGDRLKACQENAALRQGLVAKMQVTQKDFGIESTPSFVIDGKEVLKGALSFGDFQKVINDKLVKAGVEPVTGIGTEKAGETKGK